jgi:hypothetical protein
MMIQQGCSMTATVGTTLLGVREMGESRIRFRGPRLKLVSIDFQFYSSGLKNASACRSSYIPVPIMIVLLVYHSNIHHHSFLDKPIVSQKVQVPSLFAPFPLRNFLILLTLSYIWLYFYRISDRPLRFPNRILKEIIRSLPGHFDIIRWMLLSKLLDKCFCRKKREETANNWYNIRSKMQVEIQ